MTHVRRWIDLWMLLMLFVSLTACGGAPVTFADIPVYPDATPLPAGSHLLADTVGNAFREAVGQENVQVDMQMYTLPLDTDWEEVKAFYEDQIAGDWKADDRLAQDTGVLKTIGWTRGGFVSQQGLAIGYGSSLLGSAPYLMVALFSK